MKVNILLIRMGLLIGLMAAVLLTGCSSNPSGMATTNDESLLGASAVNPATGDPATYPFPQATPTVGRW